MILVSPTARDSRLSQPGSCRPMMRPPETAAVVFRNSRRRSLIGLSLHLGGAVNRGADTTIGAAAAQVAGHRIVDVCVGWSRVLREQSRGRHDLTRLTVTAL